MAESREMMPQSKRQKLDDPVVYFDPKRIPIEVWELIFIHNSARDLLNLSLVCKKFYEIIGSLPEAMEKIVVKQGRKTEKDKYLLLDSSRNYKNFKFERIQIVFDMKISFQIIKKFGGNLTSLEFSSCYFIDEEFNKILEMSQKNLRSLTMNSLRLKNPTQQFKVTINSFKLTKLQTLKIRKYNESVFIDNVLDCAPDTLLEVACDNFSDGSQFLKFLERQKNLEHLSLTLNKELLNKISIAQFKFQLEKLDIGLINAIDSCKIFGKFLRSQAESLKELSLINISVNEFYDVFSNMPNLQLLKFEIQEATTDQYESGPNFDCPALKLLEINFEGDSLNLSYLNFFKRFATIPEIVFKMQSKPNMMKIIAKYHPNLKSLVLYNFDDDSFKSVSFKNLTKLEIFTCESTEVNMENSIFAMENLNVLKIRAGFYVTMRSLLLILFNFKKLEHLEIDNGHRLNENLLCRHLALFKTLRFLKICKMRAPVENFMQFLAVFPDLKYSLQ